MAGVGNRVVVSRYHGGSGPEMSSMDIGELFGAATSERGVWVVRGWVAASVAGLVVEGRAVLGAGRWSRRLFYRWMV